MARVVVVICGGVVQSVITEDPDTQVLILDADSEGSDDTQQVLINGDQSDYVVSAITEEDSTLVDSIYQQVCI